MKPNWIGAISKPNIDWAGVECDFPFLVDMQACVQDPIHHAEGDVWTHTRMVADALPDFGLVSEAARLTALFHDVEKPSTRFVDGDHIRHPRHARYGAHTAWVSLWREGLSVQTRSTIYALIMWHQRIFHLWDYPNMDRLAQAFAAIGDLPTLINFARADNAGRICANPKVAEDNLCLMLEWVSENVVVQDPASRMTYFEKEGRNVHYRAPAPTGSRVTIMSGLPGSGKDYHISKCHDGKPTISLDEIRKELKVGWEDDQGTVIQVAFERARQFLRKKMPFVWNATCIDRLTRAKIIKLCREYDAHVTIDALDAPLETVLKQNRNRDHVVPEQVIMNMIKRWEPPTLVEAHDLRWFSRSFARDQGGFVGSTWHGRS